MTTRQYLIALEKLGLTPASKTTARAFGVTVRQCVRLAAGEREVQPTLALLIGMYLRHGIPEVRA